MRYVFFTRFLLCFFDLNVKLTVNRENNRSYVSTRSKQCWKTMVFQRIWNKKSTKNDDFGMLFCTRLYLIALFLLRFLLCFFDWKNAWTRNCVIVYEHRFCTKTFWSKKNVFVCVLYEAWHRKDTEIRMHFWWFFVMKHA